MKNDVKIMEMEINHMENKSPRNFIPPKEMIQSIIKIEAFKAIYPNRYNKIAKESQTDIDQLISEHHKVIKQIIWH